MADVSPDKAKGADDTKASDTKAEDTKAPSNGAVEQKDGAVKSKDQTSAASQEASPLVILMGSLVLATVVVIVQQSEVLQGGSLAEWGQSLFNEHIVPPPTAHDSICTVQFCQS